MCPIEILFSLFGTKVHHPPEMGHGNILYDHVDSILLFEFDLPSVVILLWIGN